MNLFFRVLLTIYAFCLTVITIVAIVITINPKIFDNISNYISSDVLKDWTAQRWLMLILSVLFLILSLTFLLSGFKENKDRKAVSKHTNIGEIKISIHSIESLALAASKRVNGVRETKAYVENEADSVSIIIRTVIMSDVNIPAISEDIQYKVKSLVEESTGIKVNSVRIVVENVHTGYKSRVE
jgi:uncharacterized alkaline shock family protein YloU